MASTNETETFQHYQVLRRADGTLHELGRGAMGVTYKAFDTNLRSYVALKVINALHLDSETARARFLREARAAAALRHRNIASVYHLGNDDQSFFYAMEFVDGQTLEALVKEQNAALTPTVALQIALQVSRALGAAGKQGLVHRDIKPANIMVEREDDDEDGFVVKVIDFGLARSAAGGEGSAHITMGGFVGTPQYASPEQLEEKDLDIRSDIYSLGITLWYMLAGRAPFVGPLGSVFIQQLTKEPPWEQIAGQPDNVKALLARLLQKDPDRRPQSPTELRREIEVCLRSLPAAARSGVTLPIAPPSAKSTVDTAAAGTTGSQTSPSTNTQELPPTISPPTAAAITPPVATPVYTDGETLVRPAVITTGTLLGGRYDLGDFVGQGNNGRVFRSRDLAREQRTVAVKVLHANVLTLEAERTRLEETLEKLHHAPHPHLVEVDSFEQVPGCRFLVQEWVSGFTLVDLLRTRGQLPVRETLQLLAQTAAAADHAFGHELNRLELGLHQILIDFPSSDPGTPPGRALLTSPVDKWPADYSLKLDALGITREPGDSVTWSGDMTMLPSSPMLGRDTQTSIRGLVESSQFFALGMLTYELLNGAPPAQGRGEDGRGIKFAALPSLNEEANDVLRRMLTPNPGFTSGMEFFEALRSASGVVMPIATESVAPLTLTPSVAASTETPFIVASEEDAGMTMIDAPAALRAFPETDSADSGVTMIDAPIAVEPAASPFDTPTTMRAPEMVSPPPVAEPEPVAEVEEAVLPVVVLIPDEASAVVRPVEAKQETPAASEAVESPDSMVADHEVPVAPVARIDSPKESVAETPRVEPPTSPVERLSLDRAEVSLNQPASAVAESVAGEVAEAKPSQQHGSDTFSKSSASAAVPETPVPVPIIKRRKDVPLVDEHGEHAPFNWMPIAAGGAVVLFVLSALAAFVMRHGSQSTLPTVPIPHVASHPAATATPMPVATPVAVVIQQPLATPAVVNPPMETPTPAPVVVSTPPPATPEPTPMAVTVASTPTPPVEANVSTPPPGDRTTHAHDVVVTHDHDAEKREADQREADRHDTERKAADQKTVADNKRDSEKKEAHEAVHKTESTPTPKPKAVVAKATPAPKKEAKPAAATPDPNHSGPGIGFMR